MLTLVWKIYVSIVLLIQFNKKEISVTQFLWFWSEFSYFPLTRMVLKFLLQHKSQTNIIIKHTNSINIFTGTSPFTICIRTYLWSIWYFELFELSWTYIRIWLKNSISYLVGFKFTHCFKPLPINKYMNT